MIFSEDDIVLTLKSNNLEGNSPSDFITHLKRHYHLPGKWQVGLAEIQIPNTYENIGENHREKEVTHPSLK